MVCQALGGDHLNGMSTLPVLLADLSGGVSRAVWSVDSSMGKWRPFLSTNLAPGLYSPSPVFVSFGGFASACTGDCDLSTDHLGTAPWGTPAEAWLQGLSGTQGLVLGILSPRCCSGWAHLGPKGLKLLLESLPIRISLQHIPVARIYIN